MDDFLSKPVQADALWEVIDRVVAAHAPARQPHSGLLDPRAIWAPAEERPRFSKEFAPLSNARAKADRAGSISDGRPRYAAAARGCSFVAWTLSAFSTVAAAAASTLEDKAARGEIEACEPLVARLESICSELVEQTRKLSIENLGL